MTKREKRLQKGIESIGKAIKEHEIKKDNAIEKGKVELADYFEKEIETLKKRKKNREDKL